MLGHTSWKKIALLRKFHICAAFIKRNNLIALHMEFQNWGCTYLCQVFCNCSVKPMKPENIETWWGYKGCITVHNTKGNDRPNQVCMLANIQRWNHIYLHCDQNLGWINIDGEIDDGIFFKPEKSIEWKVGVENAHVGVSAHLIKELINTLEITVALAYLLRRKNNLKYSRWTKHSN